MLLQSITFISRLNALNYTKLKRLKSTLYKVLILCLLNFYTMKILTSRFCIIKCIYSANKSDISLLLDTDTMWRPCQQKDKRLLAF